MTRNQSENICFQERNTPVFYSLSVNLFLPLVHCHWNNIYSKLSVFLRQSTFSLSDGGNHRSKQSVYFTNYHGALWKDRWLVFCRLLWGLCVLDKLMSPGLQWYLTNNWGVKGEIASKKKIRSDRSMKKKQLVAFNTSKTKLIWYNHHLPFAQFPTNGYAGTVS